ncbi:MAG: nucleotide kinase, partial [Zestosphaera sp.]
RLNPALLYRKLVERGWVKSKVLENVEAELLGVCARNALEEHPESKVCEIDVSDRNLDEVVGEVVGILNGSRACHPAIDWLSQELPDDLLAELLKRES